LIAKSAVKSGCSCRAFLSGKISQNLQPYIFPIDYSPAQAFDKRIFFVELLKDLVTKGEILISDHGYDELAADNLSVRKLVSGLNDAELLEDYPDFPKGPCVLVLQQDENDQPIHVVWGILKPRCSCNSLPARSSTMDG